MQRWMIFICIMVCVSACTNFNFPGVYRINIKQGNIIEADMIDQLKTGMSRDQVRYVMGSPMIADTFHQERWDYIYRLKRGNGDVLEKHVTLIFSEDLLAEIRQETQKSRPSNGPLEKKGG